MASSAVKVWGAEEESAGGWGGWNGLGVSVARAGVGVGAAEVGSGVVGVGEGRLVGSEQAANQPVTRQMPIKRLGRREIETMLTPRLGAPDTR